MKNLNTNESTSFESSLGSPTKPLKPFEAQKAKQLFCVNNIQEIQDIPQPLTQCIINLGPVRIPSSSDKKNPKNKKKPETGLKPPKIINKIKRTHVLNFDALYRNIILQGKKIGQLGNKKINNSESKSKNQLVGSKRIRNLSNKETSAKGKLYNIFIKHITIR